MNLWQIALRSLTFYRSTNLAIALGVATATAVLTGALIVGDSMRFSLRQLTMQRLGEIDEMLVSDGFFRSDLAREIKTLPTFGEDYDRIAPAILFPGGTVESRRWDADRETEIVRRAGQVTVLGITDEFQAFESDAELRSLLGSVPDFSGEVAMINRTVADDLEITDQQVVDGEARITVRIPKQTQLPAESFLGSKQDLIESLVRLKVVQILPTEGLGRFGLFPSQSNPANVYLPIGLLQDSLSRSVLSHKDDPDQANVLLLSGNGTAPPAADVSARLRKQIRPPLADYGLSLKHVQQWQGEDDDRTLVFEYWSLSSDRMLLTDETVGVIERALPTAKPVFTYLANDLRPEDQDQGIPFSMVTGIEIDERFDPVSAVDGSPIDPIGRDEIVLNEWAARDQELEVDDMVTMTYFEPETTHGSQTEKSVSLKLVDIAKLVEPGRAFVLRGRNGLEPPQFFERPTLANDPDLTPTVPGVTDAATIEEWNLPFNTAERMRPQDDDYWDFHRTTPKGFIHLDRARELWDSRFGTTTSFRIPIDAGDRESLTTKLLDQIAADDAELGMRLVPVKRRGLKASSGSTPFDWLFLGLSLFVIGSALILVSLLFRLGLQQRADQVGLMKATGFDDARLRRVWLSEMLLVSLLGVLGGIGLGVGYAAVMITGLTSWWVGAISRPFLEMHMTPLSLLIGALAGLVICIITIAISLRRANRQPVTRLIRGELESAGAPGQHAPPGHWTRWLSPVLLVGAVVLAIAAVWLSGESQAGAFMGAGFLVLTAGLMRVYSWLSQSGGSDRADRLSLSRLALLSAKRNPLRSTLTIGLVAVASFLIAAISAFRLAPSEQGTAGFDWVARSSQPIFADLASPEGQTMAMGEGYQLPTGADVLSLRYKSGEDASCNNLYQSTQPQALGIPNRFIRHFDSSDQTGFAWSGSTAETDLQRSNPWNLLGNATPHAGTEEDPVPVVIDKNTANYSLKIYSLGTIREVRYDSGERFHFKVVGMLANTILQGSLIMSETDFESMFPGVAGYQYFLISDPAGDPAGNSVAPGSADAPAASQMAGGDAPAQNGAEGLANTPAETSRNAPVERSAAVSVLEDRLGDEGFDARSAEQLLANFMSVQNTYLSTFQALGALGLLLGTIGLAAVQIRSVLERQSELGLLRAVGFALPKLSSMVMLENAWLLIAGLAVGIGAALFTTIPHYLVGSASVPWLALAIIFSGITVVGLLAGWLASRNISRVPLLDALRK